MTVKLMSSQTCQQPEAVLVTTMLLAVGITIKYPLNMCNHARQKFWLDQGQ